MTGDTISNGVVVFCVIIVGIFVGVGIALRIVSNYVSDTQLIGGFTNAIEDYSKEPIEIISQSEREVHKIKS